MQSLTAVDRDRASVVNQVMLMGTAIACAGLCAMVIRIVAVGYGYPATWLATGNAWVALLTLPSLIAMSMGGSYGQRVKWFFWLGLALAPSQATALIFALAWV